VIDDFAIVFTTIAVLYILVRAIMLDTKLPWFEAGPLETRSPPMKPDPELAAYTSRESSPAGEAKG
jgi:hypothetical protein